MPESVDAFLLQHLTTRLVDEFPVQVEKCLDVLSEDDLWWRPHEQSNAVGNLVLHVAGSNRHFLEHVIGGVPFVRDRDAEFAARGGRTKADVLQVWKDVAGRVSKVLRALTPDRLAAGDEREEQVGRGSPSSRHPPQRAAHRTDRLDHQAASAGDDPRAAATRVAARRARTSAVSY